MALAYTLKASGELNLTGAAHATSASPSAITFAADSLVVVVVGGTKSSTSTSALAVTASGLTFTNQKSAQQAGTDKADIAVFTAPDASGGSRTLTIADGAVTHYGLFYAVYEVTGHNIAAPIGVTATQADNLTDGAKTMALLGAPAASSVVIAGVYIDTSAGLNQVDPGAGWTEDAEVDSSGGTNFGVLEVESRTGSTSTSVDWADIRAAASVAAFSTAGVAIEILAAPVDPPQQLRPGFRTGTGFPSFLNPLTVGFQMPADMGPGIALRGTPTTSEAAASTGITTNVPVGVANGDLLVWITSQTTANLIAVNAGWTERQNGVSGASSLQVWYRVASSEPASYTTAARSAARAWGVMLAFSGVNATTPWDVTESAMVAGTTAVACPAVTPVTAGAWVLSAATGLVALGVIDTTASSSNTTVDVSTTSTSGAATNMAGGSSHFAWSSGAVTPAWTLSNTTTRTIGAALALRPAGSAAATGPQNYTSPQTAAVGFTGSDTLAIRTGLAAATVGFTGAVTKSLARALAATLAFTGALATLTVHNFLQALTASLSFTGAQIRRTAVVKTATVSFTGAQARAVAKAVAATVSFTGTQTRRVGSGLTGALAFTGALTRRVGHPLTATVSFTGAHATAAVHFFTQALTASLSFTGAQVRRTAAVKTATVGFTGAQARATGKLVAASVSFTGAQARRVGHLFTATVSFTGVMTRRVGHPLTATVSFTGSAATLAVHFFTQALTATVGFTGAFTKRAGRSITATVGFTVGALTRRVGNTQTATVGFVGTTGRRIGSRLSAAVGFVGTLLGVRSGATTSPQVTLVAATHDHRLTAATLNHTLAAKPTGHTLTAATQPHIVNAAVYPRTIEET